MVSVFECIVSDRNCCYRLSRTIGTAPAENTDAALGKTHGWSDGSSFPDSELAPDLGSAIADRGNSRFRALCAPRNLGSPDIAEEGVDFRTQDVGLAAQRTRRAQHLAGG